MRVSRRRYACLYEVLVFLEFSRSDNCKHFISQELGLIYLVTRLFSSQHDLSTVRKTLNLILSKYLDFLIMYISEGNY